MAAVLANAPAAATPQRRVRPGRSSSLQRMLDLEKQAMLDRQQKQGRVSPTSPHDTSATTAAAAPISRSPPRAAHGKGPTRKPLTKSPPRSQKTSAAAQLAPIEVNFGPTPNTALQWEKTGLGIQARRESTTTLVTTPPTPRSTVVDNRPSPKSVAFQIPDNDKVSRDAMCQSPTWEAYGRRKQEKKEELQEKKERERQEKEAVKNKRGRLSKQQPASSKPPVTVMRQPGKNHSDIVVGSRQVPRDRPSSVLGLVTDGGNSPMDSPAPARFHQRHRSGSFSSIMRAFDLRRTTSDDSSNGFIGGIKLEQERFDAAHPPHQQSAPHSEDPEKMMSPPAEMHPALRDSSAAASSSTTSIPYTSTSPSSEKQSFSSADGRKRSYPPIAMQTASKQTRSLLSPEAAASSDLSTIDKWRARVGLKRSQKQQSLGGEQKTSAAAVEEQAATKKHNRISKPVISGPILDKAPAPVVVDQLPRKVPRSPEALVPTRPKQPVESTRLPRPVVSTAPSAPQGTITVQPASPTDPSEFQQPQFFPQTKPSDGAESVLSVPPPPPRRSSKRKSWAAQSADSGRFFVPSKLNPQQQQMPSLSSAMSSATTLANTSPPLLSSPASRRQLLQQQHQLSSSDDSGSDYSHSPWAPSTPATSRPQSDTDLTPVLADIEKFFLHDDDARSLKQMASTGSIATSSRHHAQAAADKLLASVIPDIPVRQASVERRGRNGAVVDVGFVPQVTHHRGEVPVPAKSEARAAARSFPLAVKKQPLTPDTLLAPPTPGDDLFLNSSAMPSPLMPSSSPLKDSFPPIPPAVAAEPTSPPRGVQLVDEPPVAKVFVECCSCRYYHDMPSRLYEAMSDPEKVLTSEDKVGFAGALSMTVRCPWCRHEMSTRCCAGIAAMVYVKERLH